MQYMPPSPDGNTVEHIEGEPATIENRGFQIEIIGSQMRQSAELLEKIETRAGDQQGKAIESLVDTIGDSYDTLYKAADLYEPVGPVIKKYGSELSWIKPLIDNTADRCGDLWETYQSLPGSVEPRGTGGLFEPDEGSDEAKEQAEEDAAKKAAYEDWESEARTFDVYYNTWEDAFEEAAAGVTEGTSGAIEDGFWRTAFDFASSVLSWAAIAAGVLALVFAGPFAAIALAIGAAYLAVTLVQKAYGDASWGDVAWAVVGVVPFGKAGGLFKKGAGRALAGATRRGLSKTGRAIAHPITATKVGAKSAGKTLNQAGHQLAHPRTAFRNANPYGVGDVMARAETGTSGYQWEQLGKGYNHYGSMGRGAAGALADVAGSMFSQGASYYAWGSTVYGTFKG